MRVGARRGDNGRVPGPAPVDPPAERDWTPRAALARAGELLREQGASTLWFKLLGETCYRRLGLFELALGDDLPAPPPNVALELGPYVAERDSAEYAALSPYSDHALTARRLGEGHSLHVARGDGVLLGACWVARGQLDSAYLGRRIPLAAGEALTYETYTAPAARGRGVGPALRAWVARELAASGCRRLLATVDPDNRPAIRLVEKLGYRRIGTLAVLAVGPLRRDVDRVRAGERPPGT